MPGITEVDRLPPGFFGQARLLPALVPGGHIDGVALRRFAALMAAAGVDVQPQRMRYDRRYALRCIALAHGAPSRILRRVAILLLEAYAGASGH